MWVRVWSRYSIQRYAYIKKQFLHERNRNSLALSVLTILDCLNSDEAALSRRVTGQTLLAQEIFVPSVVVLKLNSNCGHMYCLQGDSSNIFP